jgi:hypothetical protein
MIPCKCVYRKCVMFFCIGEIAKVLLKNKLQDSWWWIFCAMLENM